MPLFRLIAPMPHLEDATFDFDVNPDPDRYESAEKPRSTKPAAQSASEES